jgi:hypothetical protein
MRMLAMAAAFAFAAVCAAGTYLYLTARVSPSETHDATARS